MEDLEQPIEKQGSNNFGKFKDVESLLKAYNNLESEFTKKSQKLSMLENENASKQLAQEKILEHNKQVDEFVSKFAIAKPFTSALKESFAKAENVDIKEEALRMISESYKTADDYIKDEEFLKNYIYSNQEISNKIITNYLKNITHNSPIKFDRSVSAISLSPETKPSTIQEAGKLAKSIIKQK